MKIILKKHDSGVISKINEELHLSEDFPLNGERFHIYLQDFNNEILASTEEIGKRISKESIKKFLENPCADIKSVILDDECLIEFDMSKYPYIFNILNICKKANIKNITIDGQSFTNDKSIKNSINFFLDWYKVLACFILFFVYTNVSFSQKIVIETKHENIEDLKDFLYQRTDLAKETLKAIEYLENNIVYFHYQIIGDSIIVYKSKINGKLIQIARFTEKPKPPIIDSPRRFKIPLKENKQ